MKKDVFNVELSRILDDDIRYSTEYILNNIPDYFYEVPASSTGKNHPAFSLNEGGLVRHVKVASRVAEEYFRNDCFSSEFDSNKRDLIRMAILLHDGFKSGVTNEGHTVLEHPLIMSKFILDNFSNLTISKDEALTVCRLISSHMGPWNKDKSGNIVLPIPKNYDELFVHNCDYLASRRFLNVAFEDNEIVDSAKRVLSI